MILHVYCMLYEYIYIYCTILVYYIYIYYCHCIYIYILLCIYIVQLLTMAQMAIGAFRRCIPKLHIAWTMYPLVSSGWWLSHLRKQGNQLGTSYPNNISPDDICLTGIGPKICSQTWNTKTELSTSLGHAFLSDSSHDLFTKPVFQWLQKPVTSCNHFSVLLRTPINCKPTQNLQFFIFLSNWACQKIGYLRVLASFHLVYRHFTVWKGFCPILSLFFSS